MKVITDWVIDSRWGHLSSTYKIAASNAILANVLSFSGQGFITCNGTDAITLLIEANFASGTTTATTTFTLVAIWKDYSFHLSV
jgi:hypothetical protein